MFFFPWLVRGSELLECERGIEQPTHRSNDLCRQPEESERCVALLVLLGVARSGREAGVYG